MQFKVITTIVLFFVALTMATPSLQTRDDAAAAKNCALTLMVLRQGTKLNNVHLLRLPQAMQMM